MGGLVLACGGSEASLPPVEGVEVVTLPAQPGKAQVDPLLAPKLIVAGTDADLAAVVLRLLRKNVLTTTSVGYVPADKRSAVAALQGLPGTPQQALDLALTGTARPMPLIRDDAGGVLVGRGVIPRIRAGVAYCDDTVALRGDARSIEVHAGSDGLVVTVTRGGLRRRKQEYRGRALQLGTDPVVPILDGVAYPRPMQRWTWYRHTEDLRLIR